MKNTWRWGNIEKGKNRYWWCFSKNNFGIGVKFQKDPCFAEREYYFQINISFLFYEFIYGRYKY